MFLGQGIYNVVYCVPVKPFETIIGIKSRTNTIELTYYFRGGSTSVTYETPTGHRNRRFRLSLSLKLSSQLQSRPIPTHFRRPMQNVNVKPSTDVNILLNSKAVSLHTHSEVNVKAWRY